MALLASASTLAAPSAAHASEYPAACTEGRVICIDKTTRTVDWMVDGAVKLTLDARFGSKGAPTRDGTFTVYRKSEKHVSRLYGASMPYTLFFDGGQAVHYSPDFAKRGYRSTSRGCVNTRNLGAMKKLFHAAQLGDKVHVYASDPAARSPQGYYDPYNPGF